MSFGAALHLATFLTAGAAFASAAVGGNLGAPFTAGWLVGFGMAALTPEGRFKGGLVLAVGLLAGPALGAAVLSAGLDPVLGAVYFASALLLARLFTRQGSEGHGQVHLLSILVLAGGAAISPDLTYLVVFVGYLFALTFALLLTHLRREVGDAGLALPVSEVLGRGLFAGTAVLALFALAFTAGAFIVFPRATVGIGMARVAGPAEVGLSGRIELAGFGRLKENDRVVLRVSSDGETAPTESLGLYWRAQALEVYDGRSWRSADRVMGTEVSSTLRLREGEADSLSRSLEVEVVSGLGVPVLPVPDQARTVRVLSRDGRGSRISLRRGGARELRTLGSPTPPYRYEVVMDPSEWVVDDAPPGPEHLELPEQHPAVVLLAARLAEEAGPGPAELADALERWLSTRFEYSAELPSDPSLEHFLLERQAGHCEYFATAMVVLLRLRGVPSRVVVGLQGGRYNQSGGYYTVRQGDAHAWVEAWREGVGWVRYEPTPVAGIGRGVSPATFTERLADFWDSLQSSWARNVLSFDRISQRDLVRRMARALDDVGRAFDRDSGEHRRLLSILAALLSGMILAGIVAHLVRRAGRMGRRRGLGPDARRARDVYRALLRSLERAGVEKLPHHTSADVLERLRARVPAGEETFSRAREIVERYDASRFGERPMAADEARGLIREARQVGRMLEARCR